MITNRSNLRRTVRVCIVLAVQLLGLPVVRCYFDLHEFDQRCNALSRTIDYLTRRPEQMNVDGLFGITLAEAHLIEALNHPRVEFLDSRYVVLLKDLLQSLEHARRRIKSSVVPESPDVAATTKRTMLCGSSMIIRAVKEADVELRDKKARRGPTEVGLMPLAINGYPSAPIAVINVITSVPPFNCHEDQDVPFSELIFSYCRKIWKNLVDIEATEFPDVARDLAIEQVLLCGMEGFMDFVNNHYAKLFRSWAHPAGCYNAEGFAGISRNNPNNPTTSEIGRTIRSADLMDYGCDNHATGLAVGCLALLVRENIENASEND